ncbi:hypothetical protein ACVWU4_000863 [Campylobacter coli]
MENRIVKQFKVKKHNEFKKPLVIIKVESDGMHKMIFNKKVKYGEKVFYWRPWDVPAGIKYPYVEDYLREVFFYEFTYENGRLIDFYREPTEKGLLSLGNSIALYHGGKTRFISGKW